MPKVKLPESSAADSYLAEIRERQQAKDKKAGLTPEEEGRAEDTVVVNEESSVRKQGKKKSSNHIVIPKPEKKESKGATITIRVTKPLKKQFQEKCERENVSQNYILEQLITIWTSSQE